MEADWDKCEDALSAPEIETSSEANAGIALDTKFANFKGALGERRMTYQAINTTDRTQLIISLDEAVNARKRY